MLATPDTQSYQLHCQVKKHRTSISPVVKGRQLSMTCFFNNSPQWSQPYRLQSQESSLPSEDPSSPRSGASEPLALSLSPTVLPMRIGAWPLGVPSPITLCVRYPLMRHSHEKVHWMSCAHHCFRKASVAPLAKQIVHIEPIQCVVPGCGRWESRYHMPSHLLVDDTHKSFPSQSSIGCYGRLTRRRRPSCRN